MKRFLLLLVSALLLMTGAAMGQDNDVCLSCHAEHDIEGQDARGEVISVYVNPAEIDSSVHAGFACINCHTDLAGVEDFPHAEQLKPANCAACHDDVADTFRKSAHGVASANPNAPTCASCHNSHLILPEDDPQSWISAKKLPYTCSNCHHKQSLTSDPDIRITDSFDRYMRGIHAEGINKGIGSAASCDDCHGMHDLKKASDPESKVNKMNIPKTCAKCHNDIYIQYERGIHGKALKAGILDAPNCADCHGEHEILPIDDPNSPVNVSNIADYVCAKCHNNPQLVEKYGLEGARFSSYQDTYHGLAVKGGSLKAATCVSCHKAHEILPATNPASSINPDNLTKTCQKCHPQANDAFAASYSHNIAAAQFSRLNHVVEVIYIVAIVLIIGAMLTHNGIILYRYILEKHRENRGQPRVKRFTGNMVYQHLVLTVAFIVLVVTGFALRYPDAWWVTVLNFVGIFENARSVIHRIAAVLLIYISFHHLLFLLMSRRGHYQLRALWPNKEDMSQVWLNVKYHLGMSKERPQFGFYDYTEKAEYWALVWGTIVMALTGCILWFPTTFTAFLPAWIVKIAETIHLYEAWLATLAIAVFHFFFVIFHPEQYPMSFTWLTGEMTESEVKHHHPAWYEELQRSTPDQAKTSGGVVQTTVDTSDSKV